MCVSQSFRRSGETRMVLVIAIVTGACFAGAIAALTLALGR
jgi:hypothetical protein